MTDMIGNITRDELVLMTKTHAQSAIELAYGEGMLEGIKRAKAQLLTQQEPVAWARKWFIDGEEPIKTLNDKKRLTWGKFAFKEMTKHKMFGDDVALFTTPPDTQQKLDKAREALQRLRLLLKH